MIVSAEDDFAVHHNLGHVQLSKPFASRATCAWATGAGVPFCAGSI
jgi:hypothetical protein